MPVQRGATGAVRDLHGVAGVRHRVGEPALGLGDDAARRAAERRRGGLVVRGAEPVGLGAGLLGPGRSCTYSSACASTACSLARTAGGTGDPASARRT
ncbi:hypothetical protein Prum_002150 [Phytohabitans rumicis]|uniref:Uncharacterized protein n=1 Tax=Phytohabitans rumicis TaxID=1076125 RepID=A0A6V8KN26_9ACTN|nr:hypothetical protein Prum_002150 [Phytohabitans rumicis]